MAVDPLGLAQASHGGGGAGLGGIGAGGFSGGGVRGINPPRPRPEVKPKPTTDPKPIIIPKSKPVIAGPHPEEDAALDTETTDDCSDILWAILTLRNRIIIRKGQLDRRHIGTQTWVGHQKRLSILRAHLEKLEKAYKIRCTLEACL